LAVVAPEKPDRVGNIPCRHLVSWRERRVVMCGSSVIAGKINKLRHATLVSDPHGLPGSLYLPRLRAY